MVDHVKFLMHLRLCGILQHNHWGPVGGWGPFSKILGPGPPELPGVMSPVQQAYTECRNDADTSDRRRASLRHSGHYLSVTVGCLWDCLSVTDNGGDPVPFVDFRVTNFQQNVLQRHLKEKG